MRLHRAHISGLGAALPAYAQSANSTPAAPPAYQLTAAQIAADNASVVNASNTLASLGQPIGYTFVNGKFVPQYAVGETNIYSTPGEVATPGGVPVINPSFTSATTAPVVAAPTVAQISAAANSAPIDTTVPVATAPQAVSSATQATILGTSDDPFAAEETWLGGTTDGFTNWMILAAGVAALFILPSLLGGKR